MNVTEYIRTWAASYKNDIIADIMPFWLKNGLDRKHGGVYTCVNRDGSLMAVSYTHLVASWDCCRYSFAEK